MALAASVDNWCDPPARYSILMIEHQLIAGAEFTGFQEFGEGVCYVLTFFPTQIRRLDFS